jgi:inhibitor of cysteine peptidase
MTKAEFGFSESGTTVDVVVGEEVTIRLDENPTTGVRWALDQLDARVVGLETTTFVSVGGGAIGSGGERRFTSRARAVGSALLRMKQWRSWQGESSVQRTFVLTINVS